MRRWRRGPCEPPNRMAVFLDLVFCDVFDMRDGKIRRLVSYLMETKNESLIICGG